MPDFHTRDTCRLCDARLPRAPILDLGLTPLANEYPRRVELDGQPTDRFEAAGRIFTRETGQEHFPLYLAQCDQCGHVQLPIVVDPKRLFPPDYPYQSGTSPVFRAHLKEFAATVSALIPKGGRVLEIASNDGTLLAEFANLGHSVLGLDPAAPEFDANDLAASMRQMRLFFSRKVAVSLRERGEQYDAIVALNVFAHVDDLNDFTAGVAELLAPGGVFVFEVGYLPDVLEKGLVGCIYHEHLSYHAIEPLFPFFARHGLRFVDAHRIDSQGGSVRCVLRRYVTAPPLPTESDALLRQEEFASGLRIDKLRATIDRKRDELVTWLHKHKLHGKRVAAFGAPAKLTTWAYALGLGPDDISCVYDDNPLKVGRVTPGNLWPIVPSSQLLADNPDAVVLFSSNFEKEIRERFSAYRGEWIVV